MLETIMKAGVVGGGVAGFPTWKKLDTVAETIILNAAECEPILETDKYLLRKYTSQVLRGLVLAARQVKASDIVIAIKDSYHREILALEAAISDMELNVRLQKMRPVYPAGDEHVAVYESTGRTVPPGGIPGAVGAVVISVSTARNLYQAVEACEPVTRRFITVFGEVACKAALIGHSERRQFFGETDAGVHLKAAALLENGITPVICIGETLEQRRAGCWKTVLEK